MNDLRYKFMLSSIIYKRTISSFVQCLFKFESRLLKHFIWLLFGYIPFITYSQINDSSIVFRGEYFGLKPPAMQAEIFAPEFISTQGYELNSVFSPDGTEFYFCKYTRSGVKIFQTRMVDGIWTKPEQFQFSSNSGDIDVSISPDGQKLFFSSIRPVHVDSFQNTNHDIWMTIRDGAVWKDPVRLSDKVNSNWEDFFPCSTDGGNLYFSSQREGKGTNNIYCSKHINGNYQPAEKLDSAINSNHREFDPYVSPDECFMIFASNRPGGSGGDDLYISFRNKKGKWSKARNLGDNINSSGDEYSPTVSSDGKYLFFTRVERYETDAGKRVRAMDIYWVDIRIIDGFK